MNIADSLAKGIVSAVLVLLLIGGGYLAARHEVATHWYDHCMSIYVDPGYCTHQMATELGFDERWAGVQ